MIRKTIRFDETKLKRLKDLLAEDDDSKAVNFAIDWTLNHIKFVTESLISPEWNVIFQSKRKTMEIKRKVFY